MRMSRLFKKTLALMFLLFGVISASCTVLTAWTLYDHLTQEYRSKGEAIASSIAGSSVEVLVNRDLSTVQSIIDQYLAIDGLAYVYVTDADQQMVAHTFVPAAPLGLRADAVAGRALAAQELSIPGFGEVIDIGAPILGGVMGYVHVGMSMREVKASIWGAILKMQALMFFIFWGSVLLLYVVVNKISMPLNILTEYANKLQAQDFTATVDIRSRDEVGLLADTMRSMARELSELIGGLEGKVARASSDLRDALAFMRAIVNNMADGLLVVDMEGRVTFANPALGGMLHLDQDSLAGLKASAVLPPPLASLAEHARTIPGETAIAELALPGERFGKALATAIFTEGAMSAPPLGAVVILRDVTAEKEIDSMKTEFISTVSHELRTPLTSILGFAKIIQKRLQTVIFPKVGSREDKVLRAVDQVSENIGIIVSEGERLTDLINDVLDIAKMEASRIEWRREPVAIGDVIRRSVAGAKALSDKKGLRIALEIESALPDIVGDRGRLIQVMVNLLSNAIKFTEKGFIHCRAWRQGDDIMVSVADTGIGVRPVDQERIFERFKQAGSVMTDKPQGTGLGLPICKEIVNRHGGSIELRSTFGAGSTFLFNLPIGRMSDQTDAEDVKPRPLPSPRQGDRAAILSERASRREAALILVVDDDASLRSFLQQVIESEGYHVVTAADGYEALELARTRLPDLVTLDLMMPGLDGATVIRMLREDPDTRAIPVVVITAAPSKITDQSDAALVKPIDENQLMETIFSLVHASRLQTRH